MGFQNCDQTKLSLITELASAKSTGEICAIQPTDTESYTKILFVVDKSGSNVQPPATDPGAVYRMGTIGNFYQKHQTNVYSKWGMIAFQNSGATSLIPDPSGFTQDPAVMQAAIASLAAGDNGGTPYQAAIAATRAAINADINANPMQRSIYVVVFISDGAPSDYGGNEAAIDADVRDLTSLSDVTFSTVYYGPPNPTTSGRMQRMAQVGGGQFLDTNVDGRIPLDNLIGFKSGEPWVIKNFNVTNLNAAPCDDGSIDGDSDADGLCDKDELRYNAEFRDDSQKVFRMANKTFDPKNRNSFDPYINDSIYYKYIVFSEQIPRDCGPADLVDEDRDLANKCEERYFFSSSPSGPTQTWTAAMGQDGDPLNFDSDGDGFTDGFEFYMTRNKSAAMDRNNVTQPFLGIRLDEIFTKHLNWRNPFGSSAYDGVFRFNRVNENGQNCYTYNQTVLPIYAVSGVNASQVGGNPSLAHGPNENVVMISFIQSPERDPNGPGELRYIFQKISAPLNQLNLNLKVEAYQSYRVGTTARVKP